MSQRRSPPPPSQPTADPPREAPASASPSRRSLTILVGALFVLWTGTLAVLALFTSNPAALSADQIRRAELVVVARPVAGKPTRLHVERVLAGDIEVGTELTIVNLPDQPSLSPQFSYVLPLSPFRGDYRVTRLEPGQLAPPLIYPALPSTIAQVRQILSEARR